MAAWSQQPHGVQAASLVRRASVQLAQELTSDTGDTGPGPAGAKPGGLLPFDCREGCALAADCDLPLPAHAALR
jgi:hypothetical protein